MFSRIKLYHITLSLLLLHGISAIGMDVHAQNPFDAFTALLEKLKTDFSEAASPIIPLKRVIEIKKAWHKLLLDQNFASLEDKCFLEHEEFATRNKKFTHKVQRNIHPDPWSNNKSHQDNIAIATQLFELFRSSKATDEKTLFHIIIILEELKIGDAKGADITESQAKILHNFCDKLEQQSANYRTLLGSEDMMNLLDEVRPFCDMANWTTDKNKQAISALAEKLSVPLTQPDPANKMVRYLNQLQAADNGLLSPISSSEVATAKMLWYKVGLFYKTSDLKNMDKNFQEQIQQVFDVNGWKTDGSKFEINNLSKTMSTPDTTNQLTALHETQQKFVAHLKRLQTNKKIVSDEDIEEMKKMWPEFLVLGETQNLQNMDEEFQSQVRLALFPYEWKNQSNRTKIATIFENKSLNEFDLTTVTPRKIINLLKERLTSLKKSSTPMAMADEVAMLCAHIKAFKPLFNYKWSDRIFYPFDPACEEVLQELDISSDEGLNKYFVQPSEKEPFEISTIRKEITDLKTDFLPNSRPAKRLDSIILNTTNNISFNIFAPAAIFLMNKAGMIPKRESFERTALVEKQVLREKRLSLAIKIKDFKLALQQ